MSDSMIDACNPLTNKRNTKAKLTFNHCTIWQGKQGKIIIAPHSTSSHKNIFIFEISNLTPPNTMFRCFITFLFWKFSFEVAFNIFYVYHCSSRRKYGICLLLLFFFPLTWRATWSENECEKKWISGWFEMSKDDWKFGYLSKTNKGTRFS